METVEPWYVSKEIIPVIKVNEYYFVLPTVCPATLHCAFCPAVKSNE